MGLGRSVLRRHRSARGWPGRRTTGPTALARRRRGSWSAVRTPSALELGLQRAERVLDLPADVVELGQLAGGSIQQGADQRADFGRDPVGGQQVVLRDPHDDRLRAAWGLLPRRQHLPPVPALAVDPETIRRRLLGSWEGIQAGAGLRSGRTGWGRRERSGRPGHNAAHRVLEL